LFGALVLIAVVAFAAYRFADRAAAREAQQAAAACGTRIERVSGECKARIDTASQELTTEKLAHSALRTRMVQADEQLKHAGERARQEEMRAKQAEDRLRQEQMRATQAEERARQAEERIAQNVDRSRQQSDQIAFLTSRVGQLEAESGFLESALRLTTIEPPRNEPDLPPEVLEHALNYRKSGETLHALLQQIPAADRAKTLANYQAVQAAVAKNVANLLLAFESLGVGKEKIEHLSKVFRDAMPPS
jgi:chromosome segregation ATPase